MKQIGRNLRRKRGIVIPMMAATVVVLCGATGLALDAGRLFLQQRRLQAAADAGALSGAHEMWRGRTDMATQIRPEVVRGTQLNGFDEANSTITVNRPPTSGPQAGNMRFLEVIVEQNVPTTFTRVLGTQGANVRVRSVAGLVPAVDICLLALHPSAPSALYIHGNPVLNMSCGAMSNSSSPSGLRVSGNGFVSATFLGVSGGFQKDGGSGSVSPNPITNVPPALDPLSWVQAPSYAGWPNGFYDSAAKVYRCPGGQCVWPSRINIAGPPGAKTFESGTHVLLGGMRIGASNTITGSEVFFYNTGTQNIDISAGASVTFTAPTTGPYKGILFYADRNAPYLANELAWGGANFQFRGVLYFPSQHVATAGTPVGFTPWGMIIGRTVEMAGNSSMSFNTPPSSEAPDITRVTLVQ
jgi:Flp pilus assembly protein TadG